jgi:hypothetical protein
MNRAAEAELGASVLAIDGGVALRAEPFAPWPVFAEDERRAVEAVLASGGSTTGTARNARRSKRNSRHGPASPTLSEADMRDSARAVTKVLRVAATTSA